MQLVETPPQSFIENFSFIVVQFEIDHNILPVEAVFNASLRLLYHFCFASLMFAITITNGHPLPGGHYSFYKSCIKKITKIFYNLAFSGNVAHLKRLCRVSLSDRINC
jgi:hypothetical protein